MRIRMFFLLLFFSALCFLITTVTCYASDPECHFSASYDENNDWIAIQASQDYGAFSDVCFSVRWKNDAIGVWADLITTTPPDTTLADTLTPSGAQDGDSYDIEATFYHGNGGAVIDTQTVTVTWGGVGGDGSQVPVTQQDSGGPFERLIASIIDGVRVVVDWAANNFVGAKSYSALIFNVGADKQCAPFTQSEMDTVWAWYKALSAGSIILVLITVVVTAFKFTASPFNMSLREDAVASMWRWLWAIIFIACAPIFFYAVVRINNGLVDLFLSVANRVSSASGIDALLDPSMLANLQTGSVLATAIVKLAFSFVRLYLTIIYALRKLVLIVILIFTPIMAWLWSLNKNVNAAQVWLGEILSNIFMQAAHAFVFLILMSFISINSSQQAAQGLTGDPNALGSSLMDLLTTYGVPLGGAVLLASVCWVAVQLITTRFNPGKRENALDNLMYVGAGGVIFGSVVFFASLILGIARTYFPHVFAP